MFSRYCELDLDDWIFDCLLTSMAAMQAEDVRASFLFVGDLNFHYQELLVCATTNHLEVAAFDFATVTGSDPLAFGLIHALGGNFHPDD